MSLFKKIATIMVFIVAFFTFVAPGFANDNENVLILTLKDGDVAIQLRPDLAPKHVEQIKKLVREGAYNEVVFHRVISGFMAQTGDVKFGNLKNGYNAKLAGMGGSNYPNINAEFSNEPFVRGTVGMARSNDFNSANSQFFICFDQVPSLNGKYTVIGKVIKGMNVVDKIKKGVASQNGAVENPDFIIKASLVSSIK